eukprot:TRINITY_DN1568_c0_g1_i2.p1 TRINITY_DN1568_c0_g1~~TRINITY_DN1568_c0_g1_i2.p1  ORF type:complete len:138 (+),score=28.40 TRINITY_DN1568_c0_g1_i2:65-478(+)
MCIRDRYQRRVHGDGPQLAKKMMENGNLVIPTKDKLVPFADLKKYDPNHYYDLSPHPAFPQSPVKAINKYNKTTPNKPQPLNLKTHRKNYDSRSVKKRTIFYSTTANESSGLTARRACIRNAITYSGLMPKISSSYC